MGRVTLEEVDYHRLLALRTGLRRFMRWSEAQAQAAGLTPAHHQLLLAIRGHDDPRGPTIGDIAGYLMLRHHSAVELVQRAGALGLVARVEDPGDRRVVRLSLTKKGATALQQLSSLHMEELSRLAASFRPLWDEHAGPVGSAGDGGTGTPEPAGVDAGPDSPDGSEPGASDSATGTAPDPDRRPLREGRAPK